jgi:hypothetical protein
MVGFLSSAIQTQAAGKSSHREKQNSCGARKTIFLMLQFIPASTRQPVQAHQE